MDVATTATIHPTQFTADEGVAAPPTAGLLSGPRRTVDLDAQPTLDLVVVSPHVSADISNGSLSAARAHRQRLTSLGPPRPAWQHSPPVATKVLRGPCSRRDRSPRAAGVGTLTESPVSRFRLVHQNYAQFRLEKTANEILKLDLLACEFPAYISVLVLNT
jgi:hypothetical protein